MLLVITRPEVLQGALVRTEAAAISSLFDQGLQLLHLRKPDADLAGLKSLVGCLNTEHRSRIVIHPPRKLITQQGIENGCHLLLNWMQDCGLSRLHIASWLREMDSFRQHRRLPGKTGMKLLYSTGIHCWAELDRLMAEGWGYPFSHVLVSPVLDSISKAGYRADPSLMQIPSWIPGTVRSKLFAMGGIGPAALPVIKASGFQGAALLGSIWSALHADKKSQWQAGIFSQFKICVDIWNKVLTD